MKATKILDLLNEIEEKFQVDKWMVDGIHIWPIIRIDLMMNLHYESSPDLQTRINLLLKIREGLKMLLGVPKYLTSFFFDYTKNSRIDSSAKAIFLGDGVSKVYLKNVWYDKFCDPFIDYFKKKNIATFFMEPLHKYIIPRYSFSMFIQPYLDYELIKSMFFSKKGDFDIKVINYDSFITFLRSKNVRVPLPSLERIKQIIIVIKAYSTFFKRVLAKLEPSLGFVVGYYGPRGMAFNLACSQLGIQSVDIQHGVAGEFNAAYGRWNRVPKKGYNLLPSIFWSWSKTDAGAVNKWSKKITDNHNKAIVGGNMFLGLWKDQDGDFVKYYDKFIIQKKGEINILITLSSIENHNKTLLEKLLAIIKSSSFKWKWWIRAHPCELEEKENIKRWLTKNHILNYEIDQATDLPLYAIMRHMDIHITYVSATVFEADFFAIPSIIVGEDGVSYFLNQILAGIAIVANEPSKIKKAINAFLLRKNKFRQDKVKTVSTQMKALEFLLAKIV